MSFREYNIEKDPKGRPWRDLALLPFLDVEALLLEVSNLPAPDPAHAARNKHGLAHAFAFDATQSDTVPAPNAFGGRFPPLRAARSVTLRLAGAPPRGIARESDDVAVAPLHVPRGWPALEMRVPFSMTLRKEGVVLEAISSKERGDVFIHTYVHTYTCIHTYIYIYIYIIYIHTYTRRACLGQDGACLRVCQRAKRA